MKLSPLNIKQKEFSKALRGYNTNEVKNFLELLSFDYEKLLEENEELQKENKRLKNEIQEYKRIEKNLQDTLLNAQESTTKTVESVKKQTALMLKEAELKAKQIVDKARENADFIIEGVAKLKEEKRLLIAKLKSIIEIQERILNIKTEDKDSTEKEIEDKPQEKSEDKDIDANNILEKLL